MIIVDSLLQNPSITSAIKNCIAPDLENINDTYSLNILAYTMNKAGRTRELAYLLTKLDSLAIRESKHYFHIKEAIRLCQYFGT